MSEFAKQTIIVITMFIGAVGVFGAIVAGATYSSHVSTQDDIRARASELESCAHMGHVYDALARRCFPPCAVKQ